MSNIDFDLTKIKSIIFEVDGVVSTDISPLHPSGEPMRVINTKDGYAMQLAVKQGITLGIISGCDTFSIRKRFESLGFQYLYLNSKNKMNDFRDFLQKCVQFFLVIGNDSNEFRIFRIAVKAFDIWGNIAVV